MPGNTEDGPLHHLRLTHRLIVAPMAGGPSSPELVAASSAAGALGSMGAAYSTPAAIREFAGKVRALTDRPFAINLFIPHPIEAVGRDQVERALAATAPYRDELGLPSPQLSTPYEDDFDAQFEVVLSVRPAVFSFVFGLLSPDHLRAARQAGIVVMGTGTTPAEAEALAESGVDAVTLQGIEAGGHRGIFDPAAPDEEWPLQDLLARCKTKLRIPLIAAGGLMTADDVRTALQSGAEAVQMGTAFLACQEAGTSAPYRAALSNPAGRQTRTTRVFSGRLARGIRNRFMAEMEAEGRYVLPFPAQNKFTRDLRTASAAKGSADYLSLWSGTGKGDLWQGSAVELIGRLF